MEYVIKEWRIPKEEKERILDLYMREYYHNIIGYDTNTRLMRATILYMIKEDKYKFYNLKVQ